MHNMKVVAASSALAFDVFLRTTEPPILALQKWNLDVQGALEPGRYRQLLRAQEFWVE
jgi:hypothetical protein